MVTHPALIHHYHGNIILHGSQQNLPFEHHLPPSRLPQITTLISTWIVRGVSRDGFQFLCLYQSGFGSSWCLGLGGVHKQGKLIIGGRLPGGGRASPTQTVPQCPRRSCGDITTTGTHALAEIRPSPSVSIQLDNSIQSGSHSDPVGHVSRHTTRQAFLDSWR